MALVYTLEKNKFYKLLRQYIISRHPDLLYLLTSQNYDKALIHVGGFLSCLSIMAESPVNGNEVEEMLVKEAAKFILIPYEKGRTKTS